MRWGWVGLDWRGRFDGCNSGRYVGLGWVVALDVSVARFYPTRAPFMKRLLCG